MARKKKEEEGPIIEAIPDCGRNVRVWDGEIEPVWKPLKNDNGIPIVVDGVVVKTKFEVKKWCGSCKYRTRAANGGGCDKDDNKKRIHERHELCDDWELAVGEGDNNRSVLNFKGIGESQGRVALNLAELTKMKKDYEFKERKRLNDLLFTVSLSEYIRNCHLKVETL